MRQELCDLVAKIPFEAVRHAADPCRSKSIKKRFRSVVFEMLGDEDARVRVAAASCLVRLSGGNLFDEDGDNDVVVSSASDMARELLHPIVGSLNTTEVIIHFKKRHFDCPNVSILVRLLGLRKCPQRLASIA